MKEKIPRLTSKKELFEILKSGFYPVIAAGREESLKGILEEQKLCGCEGWMIRNEQMINSIPDKKVIALVNKHKIKQRTKEFPFYEAYYVFDDNFNKERRPFI